MLNGLFWAAGSDLPIHFLDSTLITTGNQFGVPSGISVMFVFFMALANKEKITATSITLMTKPIDTKRDSFKKFS